MTLKELMVLVSDFAKTLPNINSTFIDDVYILNEKQDVKYSAFVINGQQSITNINDNFTTFTLNLFVVDRQTSDKSNVIDIQSHSNDILHSIIKYMETIGGDVVNDVVINTFEERFGSLCAGAYATVQVRFEDDTCDQIKLVTSVNGKTGDVWLNTEGVTKEYLNQELSHYNKTDNFKTINNQSIIGTGNIHIDGGAEYDDTELRNRISNVESVLPKKADISAVYTKGEIDNQRSQLEAEIGAKIDSGEVYKKGEIDTKFENVENALYYKADRSEIPTRVSELENNAGYINYDGFDYIWSYQISPAIEKKADKSSIPTKTSALTNDSGFAYVNDVYSKAEIDTDFAKKSEVPSFLDIPTRTSQLTNDSGFAYVNEVPSFLDIPTHTSQLTNDSGFLTETDLPIIPTKVSELTNDTGFITRTDLPTKVSDLENNVGFITYDTLDSYYWSTLIPKFDEKADKTSLNSYALKSEIPVIPTNISAFNNDAGYLTEHQSLVEYAKKTDIPTKVSQLTNDADYIDSSALDTKMDKTAITFEFDADTATLNIITA